MKIQLKALALAISATLLLTACHDDDKPHTATNDTTNTDKDKDQPNKDKDKDKDKDKEDSNNDAKALTAVLQDQKLSLFSQGLSTATGTDKQTLLQEIEAMPSVTVLAPTDEAINKTVAILDKLGLLTDMDNSGKVDAIDLTMKPELLASLLKYHVLTEKLGSTDVVAKLDTNLTTLNGAPLFVTKSGNDYVIPSQAIQLANIAKADSASQAKVDISKLNLKIKNGYVHVIDQALIPPTLTADEVLGQLPDAEKFREFLRLMGDDDGTIKSVAKDKKATSYTVLAPSNATLNQKCVELNGPAKGFTGGKDIINEKNECVVAPLAENNLGSVIDNYVPITKSIKSGTLFSAELKDAKGKFSDKNIIATDGVVYVTDSFQ